MLIFTRFGQKLNEKFEKNKTLNSFLNVIVSQILSSNFLIRATWETNEHCQPGGIRATKNASIPVQFSTAVLEKSLMTWSVPRFLGYGESPISRKIAQND